MKIMDILNLDKNDRTIFLLVFTLIGYVALSVFWSIGWAVYEMIKYSYKKNPILKAVKQTNFANTLTSIVLTQVVLLDTFASEYDFSWVNGC